MTCKLHPVSATELLNRAAREIAHCRALVTSVEHAVEHLHDSGSFPDLQGIDLLHQTLDDIAALLTTLAETGPIAPLLIDDLEPLLAPLRLGAVRARLRNGQHDPIHARNEQHVELF